MEKILLDLATTHPQLLTVFVALGVLRSVFKPLMSIIQLAVKETPTEADDKAVDGFMNSKAYLALSWLVDYTTSIKLPGQK